MVEAEVADVDEDDESDDDVETKIDQLLEFTFRDIPERKEEVALELESHRKLKGADDKKQTKEDLSFFRLESLIARRPFLLSNVVLRQNPNNVYEWLNRVKLCEQLSTSGTGEAQETNPYLAIKTFTEAIAAVDPLQAMGKVSKLWIAFAQFYERHDEDLENANAIYWKAA